MSTAIILVLPDIKSDDGRVRSMPGLRMMNRITGMMISFGTRTRPIDLAMSLYTSANTAAWIKTDCLEVCPDISFVFGSCRRTPGLRAAKRAAGIATFDEVTPDMI